MQYSVEKVSQDKIRRTIKDVEDTTFYQKNLTLDPHSFEKKQQKDGLFYQHTYSPLININRTGLVANIESLYSYLTPKQLEVFKLKIYTNKSFTDIKEIRRCSLTTAQIVYYSAVVNLRKHYLKKFECGSPVVSVLERLPSHMKKHKEAQKKWALANKEKKKNAEVNYHKKVGKKCKSCGKVLQAVNITYLCRKHYLENQRRINK